jgi:hypothetical protein
MKKTEMTAEEMERLFDEGDMRYLDYFDLSKARRPGLESQKVSISLPDWMLQTLDEEAAHIGVTRQAVIKLWLSEKIEGLSARETKRRTIS